jgi:putative transposase
VRRDTSEGTTGRNSSRRPSFAGSPTPDIETALIDPGKPWQNATHESFNGKFRDEFLTLEWFRNRTDAKVGIEHWRQHYNEVRPHSSLGYLTPREFSATEAGTDLPGNFRTTEA